LKGHPYSWSVIGSMEDLNAASPRTSGGGLAPITEPNAVIVIAGDIKPDEARAQVERASAISPVIKHRKDRGLGLPSDHAGPRPAGA
jgi:predicted Zn-dependent peptidase